MEKEKSNLTLMYVTLVECYELYGKNYKDFYHMVSTFAEDECYKYHQTAKSYLKLYA